MLYRSMRFHALPRAFTRCRSSSHLLPGIVLDPPDTRGKRWAGTTRRDGDRGGLANHGENDEELLAAVSVVVGAAERSVRFDSIRFATPDPGRCTAVRGRLGG